ncbi:unnamed protein product [Acanthoscelides obtectus]|nr:unnamed protein product [Acanthoscelides obtectus]CAK1651752.1 Inositol polyphosphate 5-phosphatase E [Acanthoscelides obtectus]
MKARQRNFLQGKVAANSLLGANELDRTCPNRELTIFVGTWNMNGHSPPKELNDFVLPVSMEHVPDILSFGTQESTSERYDWEVSLQETIGPSHILFHSASLDVTQNFDYVFWSGDLNFRLASPRAKVLEWINNTSFPLPSHLPHGYLHHDQLCSVLADGAAFKGFSEAKITFPPTYKYDPGTQNFDTSSKQRAPAYTDRILFKQRNHRRLSGHHEYPPLQCLVYDSVPSITTSDHKPVWGVFKTYLRPGLDNIPLAAGLFNRDVYLEGLKRRAATMCNAKGASTVCSVQ